MDIELFISRDKHLLSKEILMGINESLCESESLSDSDQSQNQITDH